MASTAIHATLSGALDALAAAGVEIRDMYGPGGSRFYDLFCSIDSDEVRAVLRLLAGSRGQVADLAAGTGRFAIPLAARGHEVFAVDLSPHMLGLCRSKLDRATRSLRDRVHLMEADLRDVRLPDNLVAVVISAGSISLVPRVERPMLLGRLARALDPRGHLLISVFTIDLTDPGALDLCELLTLPAEGFVATFVDQVNPATAMRTVALLPHACGGQAIPPVVYRSTVETVDLNGLLADASAAGLVVARTITLQREERGRSALLLDFARGRARP